MKILIVEDDNDQASLYLDARKSFNSRHSIQIELTLKTNFKDAERELQSEYYDGAIIDLRLPNDAGESAHEPVGNELIKQIFMNRRFPVYVVTGVPGELEPLSAIQENIFFKLYRRDEKEFDLIFEELAGIYQTGITRILGNKGKIDQLLHDIFWNHIAVSFEYWSLACREGRANEEHLSRYLLGYMQEYLDAPQPANKHDFYHPPEFYILPKIKKYPYTGDILKSNKDQSLFILLTPACDMLPRKSENGTYQNADNATLCKIVSDWRTLDNRFANLNPSSGQKNKGLKKLESLLRNNNQRYHFLPEFANIPSGFVDFQDITVISITQIDSTFEALGTVASPFLKDLIARFSHHYARQGQPEVESERVITKLLEANTAEKDQK